MTRIIWIRKPAAALLAFAAGLLMASSAFALDSTRANIKDMSFTTQSVYNQWINVVSTDSMKWDRIEPGSVSFGAHIMIDTREYVFAHGYVSTVGIVLGGCGEDSCQGKPLLWDDSPNTKDYENHMEVRFPTSKIPVSSAGGIATVPLGDEIIARCNQGTPGQEHTFDQWMQATFVANTYTAMQKNDANGGGPAVTPDKWYSGADYSLTRSFLVKVRCKAFEPATSMSQPDPHPDPHRTKVTATGLDLFLSTYAIPPVAQHGPSGTQCKPLKVTTRVETDKAGPVNVKLWRQVNGGPITSESRQMDAAALAGGKFGDDWDKVEHFAQTTTVQYKAEVIGGTFAPSTSWKSITILCNGDYTAPQTNANPDNGNPPRGKPKEEARVPTIVTAPPSRIVCVGGQVTGGVCGCPGSLAPVKLNNAAFRCLKTAQLPERNRVWLDPAPRRPWLQPRPGFGSPPQSPARPFMRLGQR